MGTHYGSIRANSMGKVGQSRARNERVCKRCGRERTVNNNKAQQPHWMCGDCLMTDPEMARRLGIA